MFECRGCEEAGVYGMLWGSEIQQGRRFCKCHYCLRHLEEVFDGWNVAGTFRPPVVDHIVSDLQTNTGCRRLRSDHDTLEKKQGGENSGEERGGS